MTKPAFFVVDVTYVGTEAEWYNLFTEKTSKMVNQELFSMFFFYNLKT